MIAEELERRAFDMVKGARREDQRGAGAIDFLTDLARRLAVGIEILERKAERPVDMTIIFALLFGNRFGGKRIGIIIPGAVERIFAIFGDQHARGGLEIGTAVGEIEFEGGKAVETFV